MPWSFSDAISESKMTATGLEPTTPLLVNELSTILPPFQLSSSLTFKQLQSADSV